MMTDFSTLGYKDFISYHTIVRREFVKRNREKYTAECFKVEDVIKFRRAYEDPTKPWESRGDKHSPTGEVLFGVVLKADPCRSGRIIRYRISYVDTDGFNQTVRGIRQVEAPSAEEARVTRLIHDVRKT